MSAVAAALAEINAALASIAPPHEGLRDFARLNLQRETQAEVRASLEQYDRRVQKLQVAKAALEGLAADGHPELVPRKIADAALQDLRDNARTVAAALAQFASNAPTALNLTAAGAEPK